MIFSNSIYLPVWPLEPYDNGWHHLKTGVWGERAVARRLWFEGFRILAHRWQSENRTDIDLVAANRELLLFCEVKVRSGDADAAWLKVVDEKRLENLRGVAGDFLRTRHHTRVNIQFNAYLVRPDSSNPRHPTIEVSNAYLNPGIIPGWKGIVSESPFRHAWQ